MPKKKGAESYLKKLVIARLDAIPADVSFSIGPYGDFTKEQLIEEIEKESEVGKAAAEIELSFLRKLPLLSKIAGCRQPY